LGKTAIAMGKVVSSKIQRVNATLEIRDDKILIEIAGRMVLEAIGNPLTVREIEVLKLIREGKSNKFIADSLNIGLRTVKFHVSNLMRALDKHTRGEL
jgi:DNA-binding NarL/FixJ family response regulator